MPRRVRILAWAAAAATYLLIVLGAVVRITGSGLGCGEDWPVCHGRLFPSLADTATFIEWNHRLAAAIVSTLVTALAAYTWWLRRKGVGTLKDMGGEWDVPGMGYVALGFSCKYWGDLGERRGLGRSASRHRHGVAHDTARAARGPGCAALAAPPGRAALAP
jgi:heme A synthase